MLPIQKTVTDTLGRTWGWDGHHWYGLRDPNSSVQYQQLMQRMHDKKRKE